jgi:HEAT repeat protein
MIDQLLRALIATPNEAADDVLVDALRVGNLSEQHVVLGALLARNSAKGLRGVIELYERLPEPIQIEVLANIRKFHHAIREAGRSDVTAQRLGAIRLIAEARQGKLAYVLSENLHVADEAFAKAAAGALNTLARWINRSVRTLQDASVEADTNESSTAAALHAQLSENRPEIEAAIVRALELHRGVVQQELVNAALLLCDHSQASVMGVLNTTRHAGQGVMIRKIQQAPEAEHVPAFLLGATHGNLRAHFGVAFSKIESAVVLEGILRKTHWLKDAQLQLCVRQVTQGAWWGETDLPQELSRRTPKGAALIAEWIGHSGLIDEVQDARLERVLAACGDDFAARLGVFRAVADRPRGTSVELLKKFLRDKDERLQRMAVREIVRRKPADFENMLLPLMTDAPATVRTVVSRAVGQSGFENFWNRYDHMDRSTRKNAGKAMVKLLADAPHRLARRLNTGSIEQRVKALQMVRELDLVEQMKTQVLPLCAHANPRVRSKAIMVLGTLGAPALDVLVEKVVNDTDARVRANAIEVIEQRGNVKFVPLLAERAQKGANRERANSIKALHSMKVGVAAAQLLQMLRDDRAEHRVSALWALRKIGWWRMLAEVARLAREDDNLKVRQYAMSVLQSAAGEAKTRRAS